MNVHIFGLFFRTVGIPLTNQATSEKIGGGAFQLNADTLFVFIIFAIKKLQGVTKMYALFLWLL